MVKCMGEIRIRTLTPLWTGDVNRECKSFGGVSSSVKIHLQQI